MYMRLTKRLSKGTKNFTIAIDDGYCAYKFTKRTNKKLSRYSINDIGVKIKQLLMNI